MLTTGFNNDSVSPCTATVINLDAAANTVPTEEVIDAVVATMRSGAANPASAHELGDRSRAVLTRARDGVLSLLDGALDDGVTFTSGCTEANNTVFAGIPAATIITSTVEHPSVLRSAERAASSGTTVLFVPVDRAGLVSLEQLGAIVASVQGPLLVSIQFANSETGVIQPIAAVAALLATRPQTTFHSDAAQAYGKLPIDLSPGVGPDVITVSGHKLHAPMGVGAIVAAERGVPLAPLLVGGDQEGSLRAGTEAVPLIAGFGAACAARADTMNDCVLHMSQLRDRLEAGLRDGLPNVVLLESAIDRLPNISSVRFPGVDGMSLIAQLDSRGVAASQGSACSSRRPEPSHVLMAMGISENDAFETVRFSVSALNTVAEIDEATSIIADTVNHLRSVSWAKA
ncbi:cysteine desulfurase family protein [Methylobacterium sp. Leaf111]|uniref:cysteine desulfurase family protein n=1 Tax=Methylobacterium sp. Leaf111 TaxID=1736257 RepID=UPI000A65F7E6|nr:cysteine desulfurase family protein [Methylobacterium sp. Leaf111]